MANANADKARKRCATWGSEAAMGWKRSVAYQLIRHGRVGRKEFGNPRHTGNNGT